MGKGKPSARNECVVLEASATDERPFSRKENGYHPESLFMPPKEKEEKVVE